MNTKFKLLILQIKQLNIERKEKNLIKRMDKTDAQIEEINEKLNLLSDWKSTFKNNSQTERNSEEI